MCSICNQFVCHKACSEYEEQKRTCMLCGGTIYSSETYYKIGNGYFHDWCLTESYTKRELLSLLGVTPCKPSGKITLTVIGKREGGNNGK